MDEKSAMFFRSISFAPKQLFTGGFYQKTSQNKGFSSKKPPRLAVFFTVNQNEKILVPCWNFTLETTNGA